MGPFYKKNGDINQDVAQESSRWLTQLHGTRMLCDLSIPFKLMRKFFRTIIRPVLLYGKQGISEDTLEEGGVTKTCILRWITKG